MPHMVGVRRQFRRRDLILLQLQVPVLFTELCVNFRDVMRHLRCSAAKPRHEARSQSGQQLNISCGGLYPL
jgi:hypothetical protein